MSLLTWLGFGPSEENAQAPGDTESVRRIVASLDAMPREEARYFAAFAYLLGRVAYAEIRSAERASPAKPRHRGG